MRDPVFLLIRRCSRSRPGHAAGRAPLYWFEQDWRMVEPDLARRATRRSRARQSPHISFLRSRRNMRALLRRGLPTEQKGVRGQSQPVQRGTFWDSVVCVPRPQAEPGQAENSHTFGHVGSDREPFAAISRLSSRRWKTLGSNNGMTNS